MIWSKIHSNIVALAMLGEVPRVQRRMVMVKAYLSGDYTMQEIADSFGVHFDGEPLSGNTKQIVMLDCKS